MKYMGSKNRFAKELLPIILKDRTTGQHYVEPFAGGMNLIDKVDGNRIANDIHTELIEMWEALVYENWQPPFNVSEELYLKVKTEKQNYSKKEVAYIGFNSYGGK
jgi:DNA adenine methylase